MIKYLSILLVLVTLNSIALAQDITIGADIWCPYNCDPNDSQKPGFMVDLAKSIFGMNGTKVNYEVIPWSRAKTMVSNDEIQGLIAGTPANTANLKEKLIFPVEEQARMHNSFYTLKSNKWSYKGVDSLEKVSLGVIQGYNYGPEIQPYVDKWKNTKVTLMVGEDPLKQLIVLLQNHRIDAILEDESVFKYTANQMGLIDYRYAGDDGTLPQANNLYIALSPTKKSKEYAKMLTQGMHLLRKSGKLSKILARYNLKDWK